MKQLIILTILFISANYFGQTTILFEDFNNGFPAGWQLIDNDGLTPNSSPSVSFINDAFVVVEDYDSTGINDSIVIATSYFDTPGEADDWLILPNVTLGGFGNYLSFDSKSVDASYPDGLEIRVSTSGVDLWQFFILDTVAYANIAMGPYWTNYTVSLDSLGIANQDVFIAFRHLSTDNFILALDNIRVYVEDPVSIDETQRSINIYPNPSNNGFFYIEGYSLENYQVFDLNGKVVHNGVLNTNYTDLSFLENGYYWIKVGELLPTPIIIEK